MNGCFGVTQLHIVVSQSLGLTVVSYLYLSGRTGHTEVVRVVFHPEKINFASLLKVFWESHDPTQGTKE